MLFKALNPEMFLEVVDFFLAKFFKEFAIVCPHMHMKEKIRNDVAIPMYHLCFYKCPLRNRSDNQHKNIFVLYEVCLGLFMPLFTFNWEAVKQSISLP